MREYFRPRRRKFGVFALVVACVFIGFRIRSAIPGQQVVVIPAGDGVEYVLTVTDDRVDLRRWKKLKVAIGLTFDTQDPILNFPYGPFPLPLVLLSAYLLLSKHRSTLTESPKQESDGG